MPPRRIQNQPGTLITMYCIYKTVEAIPTQTLEKLYRNGDDDYPLTAYTSRLKPLFKREVDTDPAVAAAESELLRVKGRILYLATPEPPMDHQLGYLEWLRLRHSVHRLEKARTTARQRASQRLKRNSKRQREILAAEYARRRLPSIE